ncbi:putative septum site-determining protein [Streptomyces sp. NBRC 110611]|uniref:septum site-determining protein Ssd n=1 Tax=Streptomyces sp. NBRC 110611 TaxID=1621259 RepID=UPI0008583C4A|nr:septum site-determining protein Ssd [Streptomyces sp. NBRC 110611]GAU67801.1 putative septum site-determining protein [Streptomyces sp. NBRC 110611]
MAATTRSERPVRSGDNRGGPLIITEDERLLDDLLRLCAAAGALPEVAPGLLAHTGAWRTAPLVIVGDDCAHRLDGASRRPGVILIGPDTDDREPWRRAVAIGAERVLALPDGEHWLVDRIADAVEGVGPPALTIGVIGGRGGAGASTLAGALAVTAARTDRRTLLVDADPLGGGLDVLLGGEKEKGLRWPAFTESRGRVACAALEESLPRLHSLRVLSWDRDSDVIIPPPAMRAVMAAARRRGGVVVVDLPRRVDEATAEALAQMDVGLLLVPTELRAVAAAQRAAVGVQRVLTDLRVVARAGPERHGHALPPADIARLMDLPLAGELPWETGLSTDLSRGVPPGARVRGPLARFCTGFWARAGAAAEGRGEGERAGPGPGAGLRGPARPGASAGAGPGPAAGEGSVAGTAGGRAEGRDGGWT